MTFHVLWSALLSALLMLTVICMIVAAIAFLIGGFLIHVVGREFRQTRRQRRKDNS